MPFKVCSYTKGLKPCVSSFLSLNVLITGSRLTGTRDPKRTEKKPGSRMSCLVFWATPGQVSLQHREARTRPANDVSRAILWWQKTPKACPGHIEQSSKGVPGVSQESDNITDNCAFPRTLCVPIAGTCNFNSGVSALCSSEGVLTGDGCPASFSNTIIFMMRFKEARGIKRTPQINITFTALLSRSHLLKDESAWVAVFIPEPRCRSAAALPASLYCRWPAQVLDHSWLNELDN